MKIEKINDNQIKCTLNKSDLASRHLKISELAYGSEKAKELFREMMQQASYEVGFEAEDIPLMIEAIPVSAETLVLVVTKVEDPEELDTRFSRFAPMEDEYDTDYDSDYPIDDDGFSPDFSEKADSVLDFYSKMEQINAPEMENEQEDNFIPLSDSLIPEKEKSSKTSTASDNTSKATNQYPDISFIYRFRALDDIIDLAVVLQELYDGTNSIYKNPADSSYYLIIHKSDTSPGQFNRVCNILSEYAQKLRMSGNGEAYCQEHFITILEKKALQKLSGIA